MIILIIPLPPTPAVAPTPLRVIRTTPRPRLLFIVLMSADATQQRTTDRPQTGENQVANDGAAAGSKESVDAGAFALLLLGVGGGGRGGGTLGLVRVVFPSVAASAARAGRAAVG